MSRSESAAELSMEDILASIRSLVPADQRGDGTEGQPVSAPPVPPAANRLGIPPAPPTLPLGTLPPQRAPKSFDDDLGDLLDDPSEAPSLTTPASKLPSAVSPIASQLQAGAVEPSKSSTPRPLPDFEAIFARSAPQPAQTPSLAPGAPVFEPPPPLMPEVASVALPQVSETAPAAPVSTQREEETAERGAPTAQSSPPPFMGFGQSNGFIPPSFGKRTVPSPAAATAPAQESAKTETASESQGAASSPPSASQVPPLKRSFFPASYRPPEPIAAPAAVEPTFEPVPEAPSAAPPVAQSSSQPASAATAPSPSPAPPTTPVDDRPNYSDALDQALKRLQSFGSHVPDPSSSPAATPAARPEVPKPPQTGFDLNPRLFGAIPPQVAVEEVAPVSAAEPAVSADAASHLSVDLSNEAAAASISSAAVISEATPQPVDVPVVEIEQPQTAASPQPTVRLSDALWSKSAPSMASEAQAGPEETSRAEAVIPETVGLIDVPAASPVVKAFGALALGLAGGGTSSSASTAPLALAPQTDAKAPEPVSVVAEDVPRDVAAATASVELKPLVAAEPLVHSHATADLPSDQVQNVSSQPATQPAAGRSLEDVVADMLRPMLKQWIEDNMPRIMEKALRAETTGKRD